MLLGDREPAGTRSCPHLRDVELGEVLVAAVRVLAAGPVTVHEVVLLPEERGRGIEVCEVLVLRDVHVQVLGGRAGWGKGGR